jgi:hypothetical protein
MTDAPAASAAPAQTNSADAPSRFDKIKAAATSDKTVAYAKTAAIGVATVVGVGVAYGVAIYVAEKTYLALAN